MPDYWLPELAQKADAIQAAMEKAGRNKSAFLWYTDAHWVNGNSKMSPTLLNYLYMHTPMNKVNFGGDIGSADIRTPFSDPYDTFGGIRNDITRKFHVVG